VIVVVAGVSGSGKSTVGALLASRLHWEFIDGDSLHPTANVAKMHAGVPLTDADRRPWLQAIEDWIDRRRAAGASAVVACSALHRAYREALLAGRPDTRLMFLMVSPAVAAARLAVRRGHFFPARLLESQFRELEPPGPDEPVLVIDADRPATELVADIISRLELE
jgi:gluconokinase